MTYGGIFASPDEAARDLAQTRLRQKRHQIGQLVCVQFGVAAARKDQKRREAEFRSQTQPLRKQIAKLEQQMEKLGAELAAVEEKLADSALYDISRKADLTLCLQQQSQAKSALEETEMTWLDAQEQLEQFTNEFDL